MSTSARRRALVVAALLVGGVLVTPGVAAAAEPAAPAASCVANPAAAVRSGPGRSASTTPLPADLVAKLDAAARASFAEAATPGAIVGVRTPQGTWTAAYGLADPATGEPMATDVHHRIGSVTKPFTVTLIMQLAEHGKLSLEDPISKYVPGVPNGDMVTLRMLADMTSGVASYSASPAFQALYFGTPTREFTPQELLREGISQPPLFAPGTQFNYSNTNTVLLGMVVEQLTGRPFQDVLQDWILTPLGLHDTSWPETPAIPAPYAHGFSLLDPKATPDHPTDTTAWSTSWGWTAGQMISTVDDMLTWDVAMGTGRGILPKSLQVERLQSFAPDSGYGLGMACTAGWVGHTGLITGYNTTAFYDTTSSTAVFVGTNSDVASGNCQTAATLSEDPRTASCGLPAVRMFEALSTALGNTAYPPQPR